MRGDGMYSASSNDIGLWSVHPCRSFVGEAQMNKRPTSAEFAVRAQAALESCLLLLPGEKNSVDV